MHYGNQLQFNWWRNTQRFIANLRDFSGDDQHTMQANFLGRVSIFPILFYTIVSLWQVGGAI